MWEALTVLCRSLDGEEAEDQERQNTDHACTATVAIAVDFSFRVVWFYSCTVHDRCVSLTVREVWRLYNDDPGIRQKLARAGQFVHLNSFLFFSTCISQCVNSRKMQIDNFAYTKSMSNATSIAKCVYQSVANIIFLLTLVKGNRETLLISQGTSLATRHGSNVDN